MRVTEHFFLLFLLCRVVEISIAHVIVDDFVILEVPSMRFLMPTFRRSFSGTYQGTNFTYTL